MDNHLEKKKKIRRIAKYVFGTCSRASFIEHKVSFLRLEYSRLLVNNTTFLKTLKAAYQKTLSRDSLVSVANRCGLKVPEIESRCGGDVFCNRSDRSRGPPNLLCNGYRISFSGREVNLSKSYRGAEAQLYFYLSL
jgi:hypothetical protein